MALLLDDDKPKASKRRQPDEPVSVPSFATGAPTTGRPSSVAAYVADRAVPALAIGALLHPKSRAKIGEAIDRSATLKPVGDKISEVGRSAVKTFSPTSTSDFGIDMSVPKGLSKRELGAMFPGGSKFAGPAEKLRADTYAHEGEAILRETSAEAAHKIDVYHKMARGEWKRAANLSPEQQIEFEDSIEGLREPSPELKPLVDDLRTVMKRTRQDYEDYVNLRAKRRADPEAYKAQFFQGFADEYFPHAIQEKLGPGQKIADFTKKRTLPTFRDVRAAGYTPKYKDPVELTNYYVAAVQRYLAKHKAYATLEDQNLIRYFSSKKNVPDGWAPIDDMVAKRAVSQGYAPAPIATLWNNKYKGKGFEAEWIQPLQFGLNAVKQGAFLGAAYHGVTTAIQATASDVQRAVKLGQRGKLAKALSTASSAPSAGYATLRKGRKLERAWLDTSESAREVAKQFDFRTNPKLSTFKGGKDALIANLVEKAGGRVKPYEQAKEYRFSEQGNYFEAWKRGTLKAQMLAEAENIKNNPFKGVPVALLRTVGRTIDTLTAPIFQYYVPTIKNGALYARLSDWLELNPGATQNEAIAAARQIVDSIDNRFGEMIHDNIFWNKQLKTIAQLATVSYSYELGTLREIGGGIADVAKGAKLSTERAAYLIALPLAYGYLSTIWQTLHTGQPPQSVLDLVAPQTGGIDPRSNKPERLYPLGDMKDVVHLFEDPYALVAGKAGPGFQALWQIINNSDWRGDPVRPPEANAYQFITAYFNHIASAMTPIPLNTAYGPKSGFTLAEKALGMRSAGLNLTDPEKSARLKHIREQKAWNKKVRNDKRENRLYNRESYYGERHDQGGVE